MNYCKVTLFLLLLVSNLFSQSFEISKIEPPNWWFGMKQDTVQLMVYGTDISNCKVSLQDSSIEIVRVRNAESPNYLFLDIVLPFGNSTCSTLKIEFSKNGETIEFDYPILKRKADSLSFKGFNSSDIIYLIMSDRFNDGNSSNQLYNNELEKFTSNDLDGRKGGDIDGIISKLDYLKDLGITTLWITPILENNMWMSYHGYAATDLYKVDPRFGSTEEYQKLAELAHDIGLKVILDHVSNHIGINHPWISDLPFSDWINGKPGDHKPANHNKLSLIDIYSNEETKKLTKEGWFEDYMPDLNQRNIFLKKYLIQNTIWWIETTGLDGIREDTYPYSDQDYLSEWAEEILNEYPSLNIVGEVWTGITPFLAAFQRNNKFDNTINTNLPCVTDFGLADVYRSYLSGESGLNDIYEVLSQDFLFADPNNLLVFLDNHDISRALFVADKNIDRLKIGLTMLLTTRGIPKILYGTEIGIVGDEQHGNIRSPFPGGFQNDRRNAFTSDGRTENENDIFNYLKELLHIRKDYSSLAKGKLIHFKPENNVYTYLKILNDEITFIVISDNDERVVLNLEKYFKEFPDRNCLRNLKTNEIIDLENSKLLIESKKAELFILN